MLPLFPLSIVQFPGAITPLHIFEPRYRKLLEDVLASDKMFGILYRDEKAELTSERAPRGSVGCSVEVAVAQEMPDGRSNILCVGMQRFRVLDYVEGEPYLQAEVEHFEDEPTFDDLTVETEQAKALFQRLLAAARKLRGDDDRPEQIPDLPDDPQAVSFIVTAYVELELEEKQALLELTDTRERLRRVVEKIKDLANEQERRAVIHHISKSNGHGGKLPEL